MYVATLTQVIEAKTPQLMLSVEGEDGRVDPSMIRDDRAKERTVDTQDGHAIDQGGYQAAAAAFQSRLASGAQGTTAERPPVSMDQLGADLDWD